MARNKMRSPNLEGEARSADLETIFFKLEVGFIKRCCFTKLLRVICGSTLTKPKLHTLKSSLGSL